MRSRLLWHHAPSLAEHAPALDLGQFPTPLSGEPSLAERWQLESLHVKRDDLSSPLYGGTKVRALEFLLGEARAKGRTGVVTLGPTSSHHVVATALFAAQVGLRSRAVLFPQPSSEPPRDLAALLSRWGCDVVELPSVGMLGPAWLLARWRNLGGTRPHAIPGGGTSPLGILGAVEGGLELAASISGGEIPRPDAVVVAAGSCGTAAGLYLGIAMGGLQIPVFAVRVTPWAVARAGKVRRLARGAWELLRRAGFRRPVSFGPLHWITTETGPGYGRARPEVQDLVRALGNDAGFRAEGTYTGKALAWVRGGALRGKNVVFWNTFSAVDPCAPRPEGVS